MSSDDPVALSSSSPPVAPLVADASVPVGRQPLSSHALDFLEKYDIHFLSELLEWTDSVSNPRPLGPLPWLCGLRRRGACELVASITRFLQSEFSPLLDNVMPIARDQIYRLDETTYFRVTGRLPNLHYSGQFLRLQGRLLCPDPLRPSSPRGAGFDTWVHWETLSQSSRVLASRLGSGRHVGSFKLATAPLSLCGTPQRPLPPRQLLPPISRKLRELAPMLRALHRTPVVLCSDAGIFLGRRPPQCCLFFGS